MVDGSNQGTEGILPLVDSGRFQGTVLNNAMLAKQIEGIQMASDIVDPPNATGRLAQETMWRFSIDRSIQKKIKELQAAFIQ